MYYDRDLLKIADMILLVIIQGYCGFVVMPRITSPAESLIYSVMQSCSVLFLMFCLWI